MLNSDGRRNDGLHIENKLFGALVGSTHAHCEPFRSRSSPGTIIPRKQAPAVPNEIEHEVSLTRLCEIFNNITVVFQEISQKMAHTDFGRISVHFVMKVNSGGGGGAYHWVGVRQWEW
jgi:hypothetical protein